MICAKCRGLIDDRYDTTLREWERYCIQCGYMPDLVCRREDGAGRDAPLLCVDCKINPRSRITDCDGVVHRDTEAERCHSCRIKNSKLRRMEQVTRRNQRNKGAKMGNIRVREVA